MKRKTKKIEINKIVIILITILIFAFCIAKSFSKYLIEVEDTKSHESTAFYFESDIADVDDGKEYILNNWDGKTTKTINFSIKNYLDKLQKTNEDITYKITAKLLDNNGDIINDETIQLIINDAQNKAVGESDIYTLLKTDINEDNYELNIIPQNNLEEGKIVNVQLQISSLTPYTKDLIANIKLVVNSNPYEANLLESLNGEYVTLNLKVNEPQDITIQYDNTKLILDKSEYLVNNAEVQIDDNNSSFKLLGTNLESGQVYEINFIKIQNSDQIVLGTDIKIES